MDHPAPLTDLLIRKGTAMQNAVEAALGDDRLTLLRAGLLHALSEQPRPLSELAKLLCCGRSNVTKQMDVLETEGWVRREPDASDRRVTRAALTPEGRAVLDQTRARLRAWEADLHARLGTERADALRQTLSEL
ncbi:MAG: MarR family transcriptional regulator [Bacteroidota bacterium]